MATTRPWMSLEELTEELHFQKALLASIDDTVPNRQEEENKVRIDIENLEKAIRVSKAAKRSPKPTVINSYDLDDPFSLDHASITPQHNFKTTDGSSSSRSRFSLSSGSTPLSTGSDYHGTLGEAQPKKRTYGNSGLPASTLRENKSRRTSPAPGMANRLLTSTTPSTSGDEIDVQEQTRRREIMFALKRKQEEEDAAYARRIFEEETESHSSSQIRLPIIQSPPRLQANRSTNSSSGSATAYNRLMGRKQPLQTTSVKPESLPKSPSPSSGGLRPPPGRMTPASLEASGRIKPDASHVYAGSSDVLQRSWQASGFPTSSSNSGRVKAEASLNPEASGSKSGSMPGAYPVRDDSDSDIEVITSDRFLPSQRSTQLAAIKNASHRKSPNFSFPEQREMLERGDVNAALEAELARQRIRENASLRYFPTPLGATPADEQNHLRIAMYPNGQPGSAQWVDYISKRRYLGSSGPSSISNIDPLGAIINRTSTYDYTSMTDMYGNPLDARIAMEAADFAADPKRTEQEIKDLLLNISNDTEVPKEDREGTPNELKYALYEHQKLALTWLKAMEEGTNKGGILADDMGLGKTISALALIVSRPSQDPRRKTTLIVGPVALIRQWDREIRTKCKTGHRLSTFIYHSSKKAPWETLRGYDVVLTTYGTLGAEFTRLVDWKIKNKANPSPNINEEKNRFPFLGQSSKWYRVILDEAQCIKNKNTKAAQGAQYLQSLTRFCLTGTPMMNGVHELFSLIKFLRIRPYNEWGRFTTEFGCLSKNTPASNYFKDNAMKRLQTVLKAIMLRRTKQSKIDGNPILVLPPKTEEVVHVLFNEDEHAYYTSLESKTQLQFNKYLKAGTVGKNYSNILVLLLRLRQAACHPHLIMDFESAPPEGTMEDMIEFAKELAPDVIRRIIDVEGVFECPVCYDPTPNPRIVVPCGHDTCSECLVKISAQAQEQAVQAGQDGTAQHAKCPSCRGKIDIKKIIDYETFKSVHMPELIIAELAGDSAEVQGDSDSDSVDSDSDSDTEADVSDGEAEKELTDFVVPDDYVSEDDANDELDDDENDLDRLLAHKKSSDKGKAVAKDGDDVPTDDEVCEGAADKAADKAAEEEEDDDDDDDDDDDLDDLDQVFSRIRGKVIAKNAREETVDGEDHEAPGKSKGKRRAPKSSKDGEDVDHDNTEGKRSKTFRGARSKRGKKSKNEEASDEELPDLEEMGYDDQEPTLDKFFKKKRKTKRSKKSKGKQPEKPGHHSLAQLKREAIKSVKNRKKYMHYLKENWISSAKTDKCLELLRNTELGVKTIIFSQFTTLLDLVEVPIKREMGRCYRRYDGSMSADARNNAVVDFSDNPQCMIMLVSLKAGNAGLNLVSASQVIILDPFWNPYVEMQAVDRAYRIGQQKPVKVHRILVKNTVEDRIMELQERKRKLVDAALDEKASEGLGRLGQRELIYLFGGNSDGTVRETASRPEPSRGF